MKTKDNSKNSKEAKKSKVFNKNGWRCKISESTGEFKCTTLIKCDGNVYTAIIDSKNMDAFDYNTLLLKDSSGSEYCWFRSMLSASVGIEALIDWWDKALTRIGFTKIYGSNLKMTESAESDQITVALAKIDHGIYRTCVVEGSIEDLMKRVGIKPTDLIAWDEIHLQDIKRIMKTILDSHEGEVKSIQSSDLDEFKKFNLLKSAEDRMLYFLNEVNHVFWKRAGDINF